MTDAAAADVEGARGKGSPRSTIEDLEQKAPPSDPVVVDFDGPDDPSIPTNWSPAKKWSTLAILSVLTLVT